MTKKVFEYRIWLIYSTSPLDREGDGIGSLSIKCSSLSRAIELIQKNISRYSAKLSAKMFSYENPYINFKLSLFVVTNNSEELSNPSLFRRTRTVWRERKYEWRGGIITNKILISKIEKINNYILFIQDLDKATGR